MESQAAVELMIELSEKVSEKGHPLRRIVGDDDSWFKANTRHGHQAKIDAGIWSTDDWPRDSNRQKLPGKGKLPLHVEEVKDVLADPAHRNKVFVKPLFGVACGRKAKNPHGLTKVDCEQLKVNMGYFIKMHRLEPFPMFLYRSGAVVDHHFDDHSLCRKWCTFSMELEPEERKEITTERSKKFRDKVKQRALYELVQRLTMNLLSPKRLRESHHPCDSQKNEATNACVTKHAPKGRMFSKTASLRSRVAVCAGINSVGKHKHVSRVFHSLGVLVAARTIAHLVFCDKRTTKKQELEKLPSTKRKRAWTKKQKLATQLTAEIEGRRRHKDHHGSGMAVLNPVADSSVAVTPTPKKKKRPQTQQGLRRCGACDKVGHRRNSTRCSKHVKNSTPRRWVLDKVKGVGVDKDLQGAKTFSGCPTLTHVCACLTVSPIFQDWCPSPHSTDLAPTESAASNGILKTKERLMHQTIQEELDILERIGLDENSAM
jgi:hypothetical protein